MGLDANGCRLLSHVRSQGADFARTAMIGRQRLLLSAAELQRFLSTDSHSVSVDMASQLLQESEGFAEPLFRAWGAALVDSFDFSDFEGASCLHDFNQPIPDAWKRRYSLVFDGGSLEHVFHFPTAIANCMQMLEVGGHFISLVPANNYLGHGFYQFSPELFFRVFDASNGFEVRQMLLFENRPNARFYAVRDPREVGRRVTLTNCRKTMLLVQARKIAERPLFSQVPLQSDYAAAWDGAGPRPGGSMRRQSPFKAIRQRIPASLRDAAQFAYWLCCRPRFKSGWYQPIELS